MITTTVRQHWTLNRLYWGGRLKNQGRKNSRAKKIKKNGNVWTRNNKNKPKYEGKYTLMAILWLITWSKYRKNGRLLEKLKIQDKNSSFRQSKKTLQHCNIAKKHWHCKWKHCLSKARPKKPEITGKKVLSICWGEMQVVSNRKIAPFYMPFLLLE